MYWYICMVFGLGILRGDERNNETIPQYVGIMILFINSQDKTNLEDNEILINCPYHVFFSLFFTLKTMRYWLLAQIMFGSCGVCFTCPDTQGFGPWKIVSSRFLSSSSKTKSSPYYFPYRIQITDFFWFWPFLPKKNCAIFTLLGL